MEKPDKGFVTLAQLHYTIDMARILRHFSAVCCWLWLISAAPMAAHAITISSEAPLLLEADHVGYDREKQIIVAIGNVQAAQGDAVVFADKLTYYTENNIVIAEDNVSMLREDGNVYMAEKLQLQDDLARGIIQQLQVYLSDQSRFIAENAIRLNETELELKKAAYTPCEICDEKNPFWQIRARDIHVDEEAQKVEYTHAVMEFYGVPLGYAPYFSHATPNADPQTGILTPEYGNSTNFGNQLVVPVFLDIGADKNAVVTPMLTSEEGAHLDVQYDQLFDNGELSLNFSGTAPDRRDANGNRIDGTEFRGHIFANGSWQLGDGWNAGFDINRSTDDTYLRRYRYSNDFALDSRIFGQHVGRGRNNFLAEALSFQGLRDTDDQDTIPFILPQLSGYYETEPDKGLWGARFYTSGNVRVLNRDEGNSSQRASITGGVSVPFTTQGGHLFEVTGQVRQDAYRFEDVTLGGASEDGTEYRNIPQASVHWRYPLIAQYGSSSISIEPNIMVVGTPSGLNPDEIVDEENIVTEFSDINFFSLNPFSGLDLVDTSSRVAYGLRTQWTDDSNHLVYMTIGQNYLITNDTPFPFNEDPNEDFSDYFLRLDAGLGKHFNATYYGLFGQDDFSGRRQELSATGNYENYSLAALYTNAEATSLFEEQNELLVSGSAYLNDNWQVTGYTRRDLRDGGRTTSLGYGLNYLNECFRFMLAADQAFTEDRDLEQETSITARIFFRNIDY